MEGIIRHLAPKLIVVYYFHNVSGYRVPNSAGIVKMTMSILLRLRINSAERHNVQKIVKIEIGQIINRNIRKG